MTLVSNTTQLRFEVIRLLYKGRIDEAEALLNDSTSQGLISGETRVLYDELILAARSHQAGARKQASVPSGDSGPLFSAPGTGPFTYSPSQR